MKASWNRRQVGCVLLIRRLAVQRQAALAIGLRHHAVHDAEGFAAGRVSLQPRDSGFDPLSRRLDICEALFRDLAPSDALQSGRQSGLGLRPFVIGEREGRPRAAPRVAASFAASASASMPRSTPASAMSAPSLSTS